MSEQFVTTPEIETKALPKPVKEESSDYLAYTTLATTPERKKALDLLVEMHTYMRPAGSKMEKKFIRKFIQRPGARRDKYGNLYLFRKGAPIVWSCHTDTVHNKSGMQTVGFDKMEIGLAMEDKSGANCLGCDDTVGVWMMLQMWDSGVPGLFIFHRGEEEGRKGSRYIAEHHKDLFEAIRFAVALDRRDKDNFITFQSGDRCCSDEFANSFIAALGLPYKLDQTGSFTDTHSYVDLVGECTNISVGYTGAHTSSERLDLGHAFKLRDALCKMDLSKLVSKRKPGEVEHRVYTYSGDYTSSNRYYRNGYGSYGSNYDDTDFDGLWECDPLTGVWKIKEKDGATYGTRFNRGYYDNHGNYHKYTSNGVTVTSGTSQTINGATIVEKGPNLPVTKHNSELRRMFGGGTDQNRKPINLTSIKAKEKAAVEKEEDDELHQFEEDYNAMVKMVQGNPDAVADILESYGMDAKTLKEEIMSMCGIVHC